MIRTTMCMMGAAICLAGPLAAQDRDPLAPLPPQPKYEDAPQPAPTPAPAPASAAPAPTATPAPTPTPAPVVVADTRPVVRDVGGILTLIDRSDWSLASRSIDAFDRRDPMAAYLRAELYLAPNSPRVSGSELGYLVGIAPELPQAERLASLARERGVPDARAAATRPVVNFGGAPRRSRPRPVDGPGSERFRAAIADYIEYNQPQPAEAAYRAAVDDRSLVGEAQAEGAWRVAWIYYIVGDMANAQRIAAEGVAAGSGEWRAQSAWMQGLASWRLNDCNVASASFRAAALGTTGRESAAAAHYWGARSEQRCRRPHQVAERMRAAAQDGETFYGQLARHRLGARRELPRAVAEPTASDRARVAALPNIVRARALADLGQRDRAEELVRHQARIGSPADHHALLHEAREKELAGAQYWLATNGQRGATVNPADRYPAPRWQPDNGWRIDPKIAFAHIIQESDFRSWVVSPADAVGLMQVRPGTASDTARKRGQTVTPAQLKRPETNIDHGQAFIELMRRTAVTQDQLIRIIAAYNAGPVPVGRWAAIPDDDPLLWMESLSYWETRAYIPAVLRNYFVYHAEAGTTPPALQEIVQGRTPRYPSFQ